MPEIKKVSPKHELIMQMILADPSRKLGDIAREVGVSQAWLSTIIHSDAFQRKLKERQEELFSATVMSLQEKVVGTAAVAVEKLAEGIEQASPTGDREYIANTAEMLLKASGFTGKADASIKATQQNFFFSPDALEIAREKMRQRAIERGTLKVDQHAGDIPLPQEDYSCLDEKSENENTEVSTEASRLSGGGSRSMGEDSKLSPGIRQAAEEAEGEEG